MFCFSYINIWFSYINISQSRPIIKVNILKKIFYSSFFYVLLFLLVDPRVNTAFKNLLPSRHGW